MNSGPVDYPAVAKAQAALATCCSSKSCTRSSAACASARKSDESDWPAVAKAHRVCATPYVSNSRIRHSAALAKALKTGTSDDSTALKAHDMLPSSCGFIRMLHSRCSAALAN
eukprot:gnl/TRDRNA2_/TRDRNA2_151281_c2_seq2.p3 gnl/TRDRNA2_/TRDRNA2_151281_c2~~gnl/TRDRNA2_/TRDRNA2_151281_c2_seq2.p3  ORF type:complete len:113 (+),score=3.43 gnl/TRDRNA2_/TRDRNA2_151281_c2_seq2:881-1219(+)